MDKETILQKAKFYSRILWNVNYTGMIEIRKMGGICGRFWVENNSPLIEIAQKLIDAKNEYFVDDVLIHELTHWYCWVIGENYRDGKPDFENRLKENGVRSTSQGLTIGKQGVFDVEFVDGELIHVPYQPSEKIVSLNQMFHKVHTM